MFVFLFLLPATELRCKSGRNLPAQTFQIQTLILSGSPHVWRGPSSSSLCLQNSKTRRPQSGVGSPWGDSFLPQWTHSSRNNIHNTTKEQNTSLPAALRLSFSLHYFSDDSNGLQNPAQTQTPNYLQPLQGGALKIHPCSDQQGHLFKPQAGSERSSLRPVGHFEVFWASRGRLEKYFEKRTRRKTDEQEEKKAKRDRRSEGKKTNRKERVGFLLSWILAGLWLCQTSFCQTKQERSQDHDVYFSQSFLLHFFLFLFFIQFEQLSHLLSLSAHFSPKLSG